MHLNYSSIHVQSPSISDFLPSSDEAFQRDSSVRRSTSVCLNDESPDPSQSLTLECPQGHMVLLVNFFYGFSDKRDRCGFVGDDCIMSVPGNREFGCIGQNRCEIAIPEDGKQRHLPRCSQKSSYIQADYYCVDGEHQLVLTIF